MSFTYGTPHVRARANVTEPVTDRITIPLIDLTGQSREGENMQLTVPQALELCALLAWQVGVFCKRWDVADVLRRRGPLGLSEQPQPVGFAKSNGAGEIVFRQAGHPTNDAQLEPEWQPVYLSAGTS